MPSRRVGSRRSPAALVLALLCSFVRSQPASLPFTDCSLSSGEPTAGARYINVTAVYAQIANYGENTVLKYDVFGQTGGAIQGATPTLLATLFQSTSIISFPLDETESAFCESLRAPSSTVPDPNNINCTIPAGPVAFSAFTPFRHDFHLTTIQTRLRAVDASSPPFELVCIDVQATPVDASGKGGYYGEAKVIFWVSVGLAAAYWWLIGAARIAAAWDRGGAGRRPGWMLFKWAGTVFSSAISGERLVSTPALLRFATPSMRDIFFHTQWCAGLAMVAVQWPTFVYPILRNTAWATLIYNVTLIQGSNAAGDHWDAVNTAGWTPPANFADQISNSSSPLFLDPNVPNQLLLFPPNTPAGMRSFAYAVGIRPQDLFGTCLAIYLCIVAGTVLVSVLLWTLDWLISSAVSGKTNPHWKSNARSPRYSVQSDPDKSNKDGPSSPRADETTLTGILPPPPTSRVAVQSRKAWWNYRLGQSSFHGSVLYGNLVRIMLLFHVPITLYSCFQFTVGRPDATVVSLVLAVLAFTFFSLLLPALLLFRLAVTSTGKLYEATRTLLMLGPLYYYYSPGQQSFAFFALFHNLAFAIVVGAGQGSGTAQAILLLVIEVLMALATSMRLPWGEGANMGAISFMFCVGRIITCVLLVILSPVVNVGTAATGWIAYAILIVNGLIYLAFAMILLIKILEAMVRLIARIPFDRARHSSDTGLFGTIGMLSAFKNHRRKRSRRHRYRAARTQHDAPDTQRSSNPMLAPDGYDTQPQPQHTSSVPSYLRPEQATTPYREDGDDPDKGYILGAFHDESQDLPPHRMAPPQAPPVPPTTNTGFTRIKGGRANFETPFSIRTPPDPEVRRQVRHSGDPSSSTTTVYPPSSYIPSAAELPDYQGETPPTKVRMPHGRRKSETAVIEDASYIPMAQGRPSSRGPPTPTAIPRQSPLLPPTMPQLADDNSTDSSVAPRRKYWFSGGRPEHRRADSEDGAASVQGESSLGIWPFRRARNRSDGDDGTAMSPEPDDPARSFQVVRRPQQRPPPPGPSSWRRAATAPDHGDEADVGDHPRRQSSPFGY